MRNYKIFFPLINNLVCSPCKKTAKFLALLVRNILIFSSSVFHGWSFSIATGIGYPGPDFTIYPYWTFSFSLTPGEDKVHYRFFQILSWVWQEPYHQLHLFYLGIFFNHFKNYLSMFEIKEINRSKEFIFYNYFSVWPT